MPTHFQGTEAENRALNAYIKLLRASETVINTVHRKASDGFTVSQFGVLEALYHLGSLSQVDIGKKLLKSGGNITMVIDNLEKEHLVSRNKDPEDRRRVLVELTDKGRERIAGLMPLRVEAIVEVMSALSADDQEVLGRMLKTLGLNSNARQ